MRAVDLLAVLQSFLPPGGRIHEISVFPSDFGEEQMRLEATVGPTGIWAREERRQQQEAEEEAAEEEAAEEEEDEEEGEAGAEEVNENLRRYELDRLRYYFAVVRCDSVGTADALYAAGGRF